MQESFENNQKIYIYSSDFSGVEEWTYYTGYGDGTHMISDGINVIDIADKQLKKFYSSKDECAQKLCEKYFYITNQCKEKMDFLNKEITTLTKVVEDTKKNIQNHKASKTKLTKHIAGLMKEFKPVIEQYPELFI